MLRLLQVMWRDSCLLFAAQMFHVAMPPCAHLNTLHTYIYIYIYIIVGQVIRIPTVKPPWGFDFFKSIYKMAEKSLRARRCCCASPAAACSPDATFSHASAPACQECLQQSHVVWSFFFNFLQSNWRPHFSNIIDMVWTCHKKMRPQKVNKIVMN